MSTIIAMMMSTMVMSGPAAAGTSSSLDAPCSPVEAVWARGSGEGIGDKAPEFKAFSDELDKRLTGELKPNIYPLGIEPMSEKPGGEQWQYPAKSINDKDWFVTLLGAWVTAGAGGDYGGSVHRGRKEMAIYLHARAEKCSDSAFILGGYSQGAEVVGETYNYEIDDALRQRVTYITLFGDPKNYLPEGAIPPYIPSDSPNAKAPGQPKACSGKDLSPYRMNVPNCYTNAGSLTPRKPYLPNGFTDKTGIWCQNFDFVCGSGDSGPGGDKADGHNHYADHNQIAEAADAIALRLAAVLPPEKAAKLNMLQQKGPGLTDTVFVIDSTGSMGGQIEETKRFAAGEIEKITARGGKVAVVEYRDSGDDFTARVLTDLTADAQVVKDKLATVSAGGGGDTPEGLLHGLTTAFNKLSWDSGATKAAVVLTDAEFHNPDLSEEFDGTHATIASVAQRSLEIDPVNVYPVVPSYLVDTYTPLAEKTSGKVIVNDGSAETALGSAMTSLASRPVASLPLTAYDIPVGGSVTYDASRSYAVGSTIVKYEWDVDGDGVFDSTTTTPVIEQPYKAAFDGLMQVRVTDANGEVGSASAKVHVGDPTQVMARGPQNVTAKVLSTKGTTSSVQLDWSAEDSSADSWAISVNGVALGRTPGGARSITVADVDRTTDVELGVTGVNASLQRGGGSAAIVPALGTPDSPAPSAPQPPVEQTPVPAPANPHPVTPVQMAPVVPVAAPAPIRQVTAVTGVVPANQVQQPIVEAQPASSSGSEASPTPSPSSMAPTAPASQEPSASATSGTQPAAAPASQPPITPAADIGPWPWVLGGIVILGVAAVSLVYRRRNRA